MKIFDPVEHRIFEGTTGSQLYGTSTPESDYDSRGVCIPPLEVSLDPFMRFNVKDSFEGEDRSIYDLGKFFNLCADNNPNLGRTICFEGKLKVDDAIQVWELRDDGNHVKVTEILLLEFFRDMIPL